MYTGKIKNPVGLAFQPGVKEGNAELKEKPADETQVFSDDEVLLLMDFLWAEQDIRGLGLILMF